MRILLNKILWINILLAILLAALLFWGSFYALDWYTRHGESVTVPDIDSMTLSEVNRLLAGKNLQYEIMDSIYNPSFRPHEVISQSPPPGSKVKENRKIYVSVRSLYPPNAKVPNVEGKSLNSAIRLLENTGFKVGRTIYKPYPYANSVIELEREGKKVPPGAELPEGTALNLIVGSGIGETQVAVPDLGGMSIEEAEFLLSGGYNLNLGFTKYKDNIMTYQDSMNAVIYRQIPEPTEEEILRWGEAVDVFLMKRSEYQYIRDTMTTNNSMDEE